MCGIYIDKQSDIAYRSRTLYHIAAFGTIVNQHKMPVSNALLAHILNEIHQQGPITFARFMELALYTPQLGYYRSSLPKLGKEGDFVTAPEISSLYSYCLANQASEIANTLPSFQIMELGAGSGKMAYDMLNHLAKKHALPDYYFILEVSGFLKEVQKNKIAQLPSDVAQRVHWLDTLPSDFVGIIFANEVMDALPVHRFRVDEQGIRECYVTADDKNELTWKLQKPSDHHLEETIQTLHLFNLPYESEINLLIPRWIRSLGHCLKQGVILLIDYGYTKKEYYHPDRNQGTLMCYHQHRAHSNPLLLPGLQDITSHIDFTLVAESALNAGFDVLGYTTQAAFLMNLNLLNLLQQKMESKPNDATRYAQQVKILTLPSEMGEAIKIMALGKGVDSSLQGFSFYDQRKKLDDVG